MFVKVVSFRGRIKLSEPLLDWCPLGVQFKFSDDEQPWPFDEGIPFPSEPNPDEGILKALLRTNVLIVVYLK